MNESPLVSLFYHEACRRSSAIANSPYRRPPGGGPYPRPLLVCPLLQQRLGFLQVRRVKSLGEPAIHQGQQVMGLPALVLGLPQVSQAGGGHVRRATLCRAHADPRGRAWSGQRGARDRVYPTASQRRWHGAWGLLASLFDMAITGTAKASVNNGVGTFGIGKTPLPQTPGQPRRVAAAGPLPDQCRLHADLPRHTSGDRLQDREADADGPQQWPLHRRQRHLPGELRHLFSQCIEPFLKAFQGPGSGQVQHM